MDLGIFKNFKDDEDIANVVRSMYLTQNESYEHNSSCGVIIITSWVVFNNIDDDGNLLKEPTILDIEALTDKDVLSLYNEHFQAQSKF